MPQGYSHYRLYPLFTAFVVAYLECVLPVIYAALAQIFAG